MADKVMLTDEQMRDAQQALHIGAMNGIMSLAILLKKQGLMTDADAKALHGHMTKPLSQPEVANNPLAQDAQHKLDQLFAALVQPR